MVQKNGMNIGFSFGFMGDIKIADNYYFTPELNVTRMTNTYKLKDTMAGTLVVNNVNSQYDKISYKYNLQYIEIPLTFKFKTKESAGIRYWGQFGIAPGFIISNQVTTSASPKAGSPTFPTDEKYLPNANENDKFDFNEYQDNINVLRTSMILGAGIEYRVSGNTSFYAGLRFNNGFSDIANDKKAKVINNVLGLELGIFF